MVERWKERARRYHVDVAADEEEQKRQLEIERQLQHEKETHISLERIKRYNAVEVTTLCMSKKYVYQALTV